MNLSSVRSLSSRVTPRLGRQPINDHFSLAQGYTVDKKTGFRMTFNWNYERYPDFEGLMRSYHRDGIKVCPPFLFYIHSVSTDTPSLTLARFAPTSR